MKSIFLHPMTPAHMADVMRLHREQNERDGTSYPLPRIFDSRGLFMPGVPVALVGIREGEATPIQAVWVERRAELLTVGCDPKATAFARRDIDGLLHVLKWQGYDVVHCDVPLVKLEPMRGTLARMGFEQTDDRLAHFYREVEP